MKVEESNRPTFDLGFVKGIRLGEMVAAHVCNFSTQIRQENLKFKASQKYPARSCLNTQRENNAKKKKVAL